MFRHSLPLELVFAGVRQDPLRFAIALLAIALGVALGSAIQLINHQAKNEFVRATLDLSGEAHLTVRGPKAGFSEELYPLLASQKEVEFASPALEMDAKIPGQDEPLKLLGLDVFRVSRVQPALAAASSDASDMLASLRDDRVFLSASARQRWKTNELQVQAGEKVITLRAAGSISTGTPLAVMDIGAAQHLFGRLGVIDRIDLKLREGVDAGRTREAMQLLLPPGIHVMTVRQSETSATQVSRAYRVNLNVLALVALFTGALLVYATQSISVEQRAAQHALWRALGATRTQIRNALLLEALATGLLGGIAGVMLGTAAANLLLRWSRGDLGSGAGPLVSTQIEFSAAIALAMILCGMLAALAGALRPALRGAQVPVAAALKGLRDEHGTSAHLFAGWAALICGAVLCFLPPVAGLPIFGYTAIAALLLGTIALLPRLAEISLRWIKFDLALSLSLPAAQLRGSLHQVSLSLAATVAAVSLTVSMAIMVASFRDSLENWLDRVLPADLYVRTSQGNDSAFLNSDLQKAVRALPGVKRAQFQRSQQIALEAGRPRIAFLARDTFGVSLKDSLPVVGAALEPEELRSPALWVSEIAAGLYGFQPGDSVSVPIAGKSVAFTVAGVWRDYARQQGALLMDRNLYVRLTGDERVNEFALWLEPGMSLETASASIHRLPGGGTLEIASPGELREISLSLFDRTFAITYALEAVAVIIGLVGLSSSVGALVLARKREFGVMRHLGLTRSQIRNLLTAEGFMTTGIGILVGTFLGWAMSLILVHVVNKQSFHWSMDLFIPWMGLIVFSASLLGLSALASWWSARHAVGADVVRAVKHDW
ncbi:MAG: FtsX-like permease family protein [Burkholderiales bacterium]